MKKDMVVVDGLVGMVGWRGCLVVMWGFGEQEKVKESLRELELGLCKKRCGQYSNSSGNSGSESFCQGRQSLLKHDGLAVIGWCV